MPGLRLDMGWADRRWKDPLTGTEVVCLSPERKSHFRNNYFRFNMCTNDGQYVLFAEFERIESGAECGAKRLWARNLLTGELHDLGEIPPGSESWIAYAAARRSHRANILDCSDPEAVAIIQVDIDTRQRRRIVPSERLTHIYEPSFSADERYVYTPWWKEKWDLRKTMDPTDFRAMICSQPGYQEMIRIDLQTGGIEPIFSATTWWLGHPNPHPVYPELFMCCQEWCGENPKWGPAKEHERIRVFDISTRQWLDIFRRVPFQSSHEHWASAGKRIYAHGWIHGCHSFNQIDLEKGTNTWFISPPSTGTSAHVLVAPNERFIVGDGVNFDRTSIPPDVRARMEERAKRGDFESMWASGDLHSADGGETIWKYTLPAETVWDPAAHVADGDRLLADAAKHPERLVEVTPVCRFRSLARSHMLGYRLESNAHVTPDSRWVIFQSSSQDDWFEVWAARVPGTE